MQEKKPTLKEDLEKLGYSKEEEYFYRLNRELIEKRKKQLDQERLKQSEQAKRPNTSLPKKSA